MILRPKKSLGQVFLHDKNLLQKTARLMEPEGQVVVEIGAGDGRLTQLLLETASLVHAVEIDRGLFSMLQERFEATPNVTLHCLDARRLSFEKIIDDGRLEAGVRVVGYLPYCSFVQIVMTLMRQLTHIKDMRLMAQTELARRIVAKPSTHEYGRLSVIVQARAAVKELMSVPASAFWPRPKVDSSLLEILPRPNPFRSKIHAELFDDFVTAAFQYRRKTLLNSLARSAKFSSRREAVRSQLKHFSLSSSCRAQEISVSIYLYFAEQLAMRCGE